MNDRSNYNWWDLKYDFIKKIKIYIQLDQSCSKIIIKEKKTIIFKIELRVLLPLSGIGRDQDFLFFSEKIIKKKKWNNFKANNSII